MKNKYFFYSDRLAYRTIEESDSEQISIWRSTRRIIKYYKDPVARSISDQIKWYNERYLVDDTRYDFIVSCKGIPVGFVALINISDNEAEVSYTIGNADFLNKGLSKEMINAICQFGYEILNINVFTAEINVENVVSQNAAISAGFTFKCRLGDFYVYSKVINR